MISTNLNHQDADKTQRSSSSLLLADLTWDAKRKNGLRMKVDKATKGETEAQIETRAKEALIKALPWLAAHKIEQQITFTLRFGHTSVEINGKEKGHVSGRCDILVSIDDTPTILLELKRPGLGITPEDVEQGLSYARVMHPRPPLVIATDGSAHQLVETHTGAEWKPIEENGRALKVLLENVARVSAEDLKSAVSRLLGNDPTILFTAARAVTESFINERMGDWRTPELPFVEDFLIPREAVRDAVGALSAGDRLILIEGAPLAGKSSALRELAGELAENDDFAVMLLDADSGIDLFTTLADVMSAHFGWPLTPFEARQWVQQYSRSTGPALVLAVDDFDGAQRNFRQDLEALTSELFGDRVRVILSLDEGAAYRLSLASNGRATSAVKRRGAKSFAIGKLNDVEFRKIWEYLSLQGIQIMPGGEHTPALRLPWVMRLMCDQALAGGRPSEEHFAIVPSVPYMGILQKVRREAGFSSSHLDRYREVAHAIWKDILAGGQSVELRLEQLEFYLVRRKALRDFLGENEISEMLQTGLLGETRSPGGETVFAAKFPIALASELAYCIAQKIIESSDPETLTRTLANIAGSVPLGPVVVANGILDAAERKATLDFELFKNLLAIIPHRSTLPVGTKMAFRMPNGQHIDLEIANENRLEVKADGEVHLLDLEDEQLGSTTADVEAWTILSHLACRPMELAAKDNPQSGGRFDVHLLLKIGSFPAPLVEVAGRDQPLALHTHDLPCGGEAICSKCGIVEPITFAIYRLFSNEPELATQFLNAALETGSLPLMLRIHAALNVLGAWSEEASQLNQGVVKPAISILMQPEAAES